MKYQIIKYATPIIILIWLIYRVFTQQANFFETAALMMLILIFVAVEERQVNVWIENKKEGSE